MFRIQFVVQNIVDSMKYAVGVRNVDITIGVKPTSKESGLLIKNECYWQNMHFSAELIVSGDLDESQFFG